MYTTEDKLQDYRKALKKHRIPEVYGEIIRYMRSLRTAVQRTLETCEVGSLYEGLLDRTYFPLTSATLRNMGLKLAVVFVHEKGTLELWISGRNRKVMNQYQGVFSSEMFQEHRPYHEKKNQDALLEMVLMETLDLDESLETYGKILGSIKKILETVESQSFHQA